MCYDRICSGRYPITTQRTYHLKAEPDDEATEITVAVLPNGYVLAQASAERLDAEAIRIIATATRAAQRSANS